MVIGQRGPCALNSKFTIDVFLFLFFEWCFNNSCSFLLCFFDFFLESIECFLQHLDLICLKGIGSFWCSFSSKMYCVELLCDLHELLLGLFLLGLDCMDAPKPLYGVFLQQEVVVVVCLLGFLVTGYVKLQEGIENFSIWPKHQEAEDQKSNWMRGTPSCCIPRIFLLFSKKSYPFRLPSESFFYFCLQLALMAQILQ